MNMLIINSGSSSLKFSVFDKQGNLLTEGQYKHYSQDEFIFEYMINNQEHKESIEEQKWEFRSKSVLEFLEIQNIIVDAVVHRIVHGGELFSSAVKLTPQVLEQVEQFSEYAPLHNPAQLKIIQQMIRSHPQLQHFGVFDTAFHASIPKENFLYGLPYEYYEHFKVRKYGFHGISHQYIAKQVEQRFGLNEKVISCHLGSGSSVSAIQNGKSIANSFGFGPSENIITSTRVGEVDFDALLYVKQKLGFDDKKIVEVINKKSGLLGISGYTNDMKQLLDDYDSNERARLAIDMYVDSVSQYIYQMFYKLQGCEILVFTAGIGEGSDVIRSMIVKKLAPIQIYLHEDHNKDLIDAKEYTDLTAEHSAAHVVIIPANEAREMFDEVIQLMQ